MTIEEIFKKLAAHMVKGLMVHEELANYYDFLGLKGYKECHEYHFLKETCGYRELCHYYINHYSKLIEKEEVKGENIIPSSWYKHVREDVDTGLKRESVKMGVQTWVNWEKETKTLYQLMYKELVDLGEIATAIFLKECICDVDKELERAEKSYLNKRAIDYNISTIIGEQHSLHDKYKIKKRALY